MSEVSPEDRARQRQRFEVIADAYRMNDEDKERFWSLVHKFALPADDVSTFFVGGVAALDRVARVVDTLPSEIEDAAKRSVALVAAAAAKDASAKAKASIEAETDAVLVKTRDIVVNETIRYLDTASKEVIAKIERKDKTDAIFWGGSLALVVVAVGLICGSVGWSLSKNDTAAGSGLVSSAVATGGGWVEAIIKANNLKTTIEKCAASGRVVVENGSRVCKGADLWIDAPKAPTDDGSGIYGWLASQSPWSLLLGGLVIGATIRRVIRFFTGNPIARFFFD